jgi:hypothetical protein
MTDTDDTRIDWTRWEQERTVSYTLRVLSQAVWVVGDKCGRAGYVVNQWLWAFSDWLLDVAHPPMPPTEIDLAADQ